MATLKKTSGIPFKVSAPNYPLDQHRWALLSKESNIVFTLDSKTIGRSRTPSGEVQQVPVVGNQIIPMSCLYAIFNSREASNKGIDLGSLKSYFSNINKEEWKKIMTASPYTCDWEYVTDKNTGMVRINCCTVSLQKDAIIIMQGL